MRVRYLGPDIGIDGLLDNHEYEVLGVDEICGYLRVVDESGEDYLYHPIWPQPVAGIYGGGRFQIIEDDEKGTLANAMAAIEA